MPKDFACIVDGLQECAWKFASLESLFKGFPPSGIFKQSAASTRTSLPLNLVLGGSGVSYVNVHTNYVSVTQHAIGW